MNILFRLDASKRIGNGHLVRCLTLADRLRIIGAEITFICRAEEKTDYNILFSSEHKVELLKNKANKYDESYASWLAVDWEEDAEEVISVIKHLDNDIDLLIVDHYGIDSRWHRKLRDYCRQIFVIDDLADRELDCDFLLNSSFFDEMEDYRGLLINKKCKSFIGPDYALINPKYNQLRLEALIKRRNKTSINEILVFMGSMDPDNYSGLVIEAIQSFKWQASIGVKCVLSSRSPSLEIVKKKIELMEEDSNPSYSASYLENNKSQTVSYRPKIKIYSGTEKMENFIFNADLCIGSGGNSAWERCVLGLPTLLTTIAPNQKRSIETISERGAADVWKSKNDLLDLFGKYSSNGKKLKLLQENAFNLCDGLGLDRLTESIMKDISL